VHVPYRGTAPAVNDLLGGQVQMVFLDTPILLPHIKSGKFRALAVAAKERAPSATVPFISARSSKAKYSSGARW